MEGKGWGVGGGWGLGEVEGVERGGRGEYVELGVGGGWGLGECMEGRVGGG